MKQAAGQVLQAAKLTGQVLHLKLLIDCDDVWMHEQATSVKSKNHIIFACQENLAYLGYKFINRLILVSKLI